MDYYEEDMDEDHEPQYEITYEGDSSIYYNLVRDGVAEARFINGDIFQGEYKNSKRHGRGVYTYINGAKYDGEYVEGLKDGQGIMTFPDGSSYSGQYKAGKRDGVGKYVYNDGEEYEGNWRNDLKHGTGIYRYNNKSVFTGVWSNGQVLHGRIVHVDGSIFQGTFQSTTPNGDGLFTFPSGLTEFGRFEGGKWVKDRFTKPGPFAKPPSKKTSPIFHQALRLIVKSVFKADHFENVHYMRRKARKELDADGNVIGPVIPDTSSAPNFRRAGAQSQVFVTAQPTIPGIRSVLEYVNESGYDNITWISLRQEPSVYVNDKSYHPRERKTLNASISLPAGLTQEEREELEERFSHRVLKDILWRGNEIVYYKENHANDPAERKNIELSEGVKDVAMPNPEEDDENQTSGVRSLRKVMDALAEDEGHNVEYAQIPFNIKAKSVFNHTQIDQLVEKLREADDGTAIVFSSRTGRLRSTLGASVALLVQASQRENDEEEDEELDEEDGEEKKEKAPAKPEYDPAEPDYLRGQYECVMNLTNSLHDGMALKKEVDKVIDAACSDVDNLRETIFRLKTVHEMSHPEQQQLVWEEAVSFLQHYMYLILIFAYLKEHIHDEEDNQVTFSDWCESGIAKGLFEEYFNQNQLSTFNWV